MERRQGAYFLLCSFLIFLPVSLAFPPWLVLVHCGEGRRASVKRGKETKAKPYSISHHHSSSGPQQPHLLPALATRSRRRSPSVTPLSFFLSLPRRLLSPMMRDKIRNMETVSDARLAFISDSIPGATGHCPAYACTPLYVLRFLSVVYLFRRERNRASSFLDCYKGGLPRGVEVRSIA